MNGYQMPDWLHGLGSWLVARRFYRVAAWLYAVTLKAGVWGRL